MPLLSILIAEDDAVLREMYKKTFESKGYDVRTAENGRQAIETIQDSEPDLMICDIRMPKSDGYDVLKAFPKAGRAFPIIMLTNFDQPDLRQKATELGADDYRVKKDLTIRSLHDIVRHFLSEKSTREDFII